MNQLNEEMRKESSRVEGTIRAKAFQSFVGLIRSFISKDNGKF